MRWSFEKPFRVGTYQGTFSWWPGLNCNVCISLGVWKYRPSVDELVMSTNRLTLRDAWLVVSEATEQWKECLLWVVLSFINRDYGTKPESWLALLPWTRLLLLWFCVVQYWCFMCWLWTNSSTALTFRFTIKWNLSILSGRRGADTVEYLTHTCATCGKRSSEQKIHSILQAIGMINGRSWCADPKGRDSR